MRNNKIINIEEDFSEAIKIAGEIYLNSGVFIYPTDTIYGIGGNPFNSKTVKRIAEIKQRDIKKQFILLIDSVRNLLRYVSLKKENHKDFLFNLYPNTISVILNLNDEYKEKLNQEDAAFRIPDNKFCRNLLMKINNPLISTSVNKSNNPALKNIDKIILEFSESVDKIFVSREILKSNASTIISLTKTKPELVREGNVKFDEIIKIYSDI